MTKFYCQPLLLEILGNMYITIVCFADCNVINFEINPYLSNQTIFLHNEKVKTKI